MQKLSREEFAKYMEGKCVRMGHILRDLIREGKTFDEIRQDETFSSYMQKISDSVRDFKE